MEAVRLTQPMGPWPAEARGCREDERATHVVGEGLEGVPLDRRALVDVASEDELYPRRRERSQRDTSLLERELPRSAPGGRGEMVMADDDAERARGCIAQYCCGGLETGHVEPAALVPPGACRVEAANDGPGGANDRIGCAEDRYEPVPGARDPRRQRVGEVVVAGNSEDRDRQSVEESLRLLELRRPAAIREVAARDHELRRQLVTKCHERIVELGHLAGATMEIGDVDRARVHGRTRLYTRRMSEQSPEIFDDLYLGLQAGGALRKQRRGEELTEQEAAALGHWQRLSLWRKVIAIGAFAVGTFGLGFTLGGLIFGRHRRA
jgi:hypothetical protein